MTKSVVRHGSPNGMGTSMVGIKVRASVLCCGLGVLLGSGSVKAQTNVTIPVSGGSGSLTYTVTTSVNSSCPVSQPPSSYQNVTQTSFSNFIYNGITESGSALNYISVPTPNSYCPPVGWQGPIPLPLSPQSGGNTYYILFYPPSAPNFTSPGTASMDALNLSVSANPATWGNSLQITATETFPNLSGTVTFLDGSSSIGTASMSNSVATLSTSSLAVGSHSLSATYTSMAGTVTTSSLTLTVNKANPVITWSNPGAITYGTALSGTQLNASANVGGSFSYSPASGTVLGAGTQTLSVTFTPTDTTHYNTVSSSVSMTVYKATPSISWGTPAAITYGTALSGTQLDASASVGGSISYSPASGTVLGAGAHTLTASFTPTDTTDYNTASASVSITVNKATPSISWGTPSAITYGTALSGTQLNASTGVSGSFSYSPSSGTVLTAGSHTLSTTFTPSDTTDYNSASASVSLAVNKATPSISWGAPSAITYGTALSGTQLNASASVGGTISYSPASGTVLGAGGQTLSASFTPSDTTDYNNASASVSLTVNKASLTVTANGANRTYGASNPTFTASYSGFVNGETTSVLSGAPSLTTSATASTGVGSYTITAAQGTLSASNYQFSFVNGTLTISAAALTVSANNLSRPYLAANPTLTVSYSGFVNGETSSVLSGSPSLSTTATSNSNAAQYPITITAGTLADPNYLFTFVNGTLTVTQLSPTISWPQPSSVPNGTSLSSLQLDAVADVPGSFSYSPAAGTTLSAGTQTLSATFTPSDNVNYKTVTASTPLKVLSGTKSDSGTVTLSIDTGSSYVEAASTTYGAGATPTTIAAGLAAGVLSGSPVNVTELDDQIVIQSKTTGQSTNFPYIIQTTTYDSTDFAQPSFAYPSITGSLDGGADPDYSGGTLYSYSLNYDLDGNVIGNTDKLTGTWTYNYDTLNRLAGASTNQSGNPNPYYCWNYDGFGNRLQQNMSSAAFQSGSGGPSPCTPQSSATQNPDSASYYSNNRIEQTNAQGVAAYPDYDLSGDLMTDGKNKYLFDADGRICAVSSTPVLGMTTLTGYIYNAEGVRVSKGSITSWSCDPTVNGYKTIQDYVIGAGGQAVSEVGVDANGTMTPQRTYVYAGGALIATYDPNGLHFRATDWLGSFRAGTDYEGVLETTSTMLPFGDQLSGSSSDPHHFTGKERDSESGNDYFGARYYASTMGRMLSPDPVFATIDRVADPQQWNMYAYARNNPLSITDPTGLDFNLTCSGGNTATCQNGLQGQTTTDANGKSTFTATDVDMNDPKNAGAGYHDQFGNQYTGSFDQNSGVSFTNTATGDTSSNSRFIDGSDQTNVNGSGAFSGIQGQFNSNCGGSCEAKGSLYDLPGHAGAVSTLEKMIGASFEDNLNFFGGHGKSISFRFGDDQLTHIVNHLGGLDQGKQEVHFEGHPPGRDLTNFVLHQVDAIRDSANHQSAQEPRLP